MKRIAISRKTRFEIMSRDGFTCRYCGRRSPEVVLEIDHLRPVVSGGCNCSANLVTACYDCNRGKGRIVIFADDDYGLGQVHSVAYQFEREAQEYFSDPDLHIVDYAWAGLLADKTIDDFRDTMRRYDRADEKDKARFIFVMRCNINVYIIKMEIPK